MTTTTTDAPEFELAYCYYCRGGAVMRLRLWVEASPPSVLPAGSPLEPAYFVLIGALPSGGLGGGAPLRRMAALHAQSDRAWFQA
jgi:hypothetical protein